MPEDTPTAAPQMEHGKRYRVRYRAPGQRLDREAVMVYLSESRDDFTFSARPAAGTQCVPRSWLRSVEPVADEVTAYINRIMR